MKSVTSDFVETKIYFVRGEKVLLDTDLADLYEIETRVLNQAVRRNIKRFPKDFMFEISKEELSNLKSQIVISSWGGRRKAPLAFTEQGVAMLSSVLNSDRAIEANIVIMRTFVAMRRWMKSNKELAAKIRQLEEKYDEQFKEVFEAISQLMREEKEMRPIGFRIPERNPE